MPSRSMPETQVKKMLATRAKNAAAKKAAKNVDEAIAHAEATEKAWQDIAKDSAERDAKAKAPKAKRPSPSKMPVLDAGAILADEATKREAKASKTTPEPKPRDQRLPAAGTVLTKRAADGRVAELTVGTGNGGTYKGTEYTSLSSAARAAATDLGLNVNQNGFLFWGLIKPAASKDPVLAASKAICSMASTLRAAWAAGTADDRKAIASMIAEMKVDLDEATKTA